MTHTQKQIERHYLDSVRSRVSDFPVGPIAECEEPDFVIETPETTLGIEITRIFCESAAGQLPDQRHHSEEQRIINRAQELATQLNLPPLQISAYFSTQNRVRKQRRDSIVVELLQCIRSNIPTNDDYSVDLDYRHGLPCEIDVVSVSRYSNVAKPLWQTSSAGFIIQDCIGDFQHAIDCKNDGYERYLEQCATCWLLIVADWFAGSSAFYDPSAKTLEHEYSTAFERVYFLDSFSGRVSRLRTTKTVV